MNSSTLTATPSSSSFSSCCFIKSFKCTSTSINPNPVYNTKFKINKQNNRKLLYKSLISSSRNTSSTVFCSAVTSDFAAGKLQRLVSEFKSLPKPIDRVKRLLHYAARLSPLDESARVPANRVTGCTAQVWVEVRMDEFGRMRFGADSDSEITKAFCSCLIWVLDGAEPEEVLMVKTEDLAEMNVGLPGKAHSRVNTWHIVLISMQKRTKALVADREGKPLVTTDIIRAKGNYAEAQCLYVQNSRQDAFMLEGKKMEMLSC